MQSSEAKGRMLHCKACGTPLDRVFLDLGEQPLANAYLTADQVAAERRYPLTVRVCEQCLLVQADHDLPADAIFTPDYAYFSSYSRSWVEHARRYAEMMRTRFGLGGDSLVAEVASNDGYLLQHFHAAGVPVLGIEPTANTAAAARQRGVRTETLFFGTETARALRARYGAADVIAANNVVAHVPDILDFVGGFCELLAPEGVATFEFPHLLELIRGVKFDTIYHEHYSYISLVALERVLAECGLRAFDLEQLTTHGGSLRVFVCHKAAAHRETPALEAFRAEERAAGLHGLAGYDGFEARVQDIRRAFLGFLEKARAEGKSVAAYGAAAKGNTFLNYCGVGTEAIASVADASAAKQGRLLPGSHVPIVSPDELRAGAWDYVVILPWNLFDEIAADLKPLRQRGTRLVTAIPELRLV